MSGWKLGSRTQQASQGSPASESLWALQLMLLIMPGAHCHLAQTQA